jgi:site-specific DNA-adenine methylase
MFEEISAYYPFEKWAGNKILLANAKEGDFVYLDAPFGHVALTDYFVEYRFDEDQRQVADKFRKLDDRKCKVLLTTSTPFVRELFADFN